ncbi:MAG: metallophosphoesterase [Ruminococcus sp.]|nr:metallophosphoesterase [Ruminococcus sp.]
MNKIIRKVLFIGALYALMENTVMLRVRHENLGGDIKAAHISDLHKRSFGRNNSRICRKIEREAPDIILITGDLVSRSSRNFDTASKTLEQLCRIAPVYMILGNHEKSIHRDNISAFKDAVRKSGAILLKNDCVSLNIKGKKIKLYGLSEKYSTYKKNNGYHDLDKLTVEDLEKNMGKCPDKAVENEQIWLMAHNPLFGKEYAEWGADYTFSGHVHGGAVRLFGKGILSPERKFFPEYSKGVYTISKMKLLVSGGLGKLRLFNPPEIVIYYM